MEQISCLCPRFFKCYQYQEGSADATDQLIVNTVLYDKEPASSECYMFRVLTPQLNALETFAICKAFVNSFQSLRFFTMPFLSVILSFFKYTIMEIPKLNCVRTSISLTCPANSPQTPTMQRMLKTAEPTMVPTPTSP